MRVSIYYPPKLTHTLNLFYVRLWSIRAPLMYECEDILLPQTHTHPHSVLCALL